MRICALVLFLFAIVGYGTRSENQGNPPAAPITVTPEFNFGISVRDAEKTASGMREISASRGKDWDFGKRFSTCRFRFRHVGYCIGLSQFAVRTRKTF